MLQLLHLSFINIGINIEQNALNTDDWIAVVYNK
jgi:hypothetical protein